MTTGEPLNTVYCEGWEPGGRVIVGRLTVATARQRDEDGRQYAVAFVNPRTELPEALVEIAWGEGFARWWHFDKLGRRNQVAEYRRVEADRLFRLRAAAWSYTTPEQPEFDPEHARFEEVRNEPDGTVRWVLQPRGDSGSRRHSRKRGSVEDMYIGVPQFGDWAALAGLTVPPRESPDPEADEVAVSPWRPVRPMSAEGVERLFRGGVRWLLAESDQVVVTDVREGDTLPLTTGQVVVADPSLLGNGLEPFVATVPAGEYRVELTVVRFEDEPDHERVAAAKLVVSTEPVTSWELALQPGQDPSLLGEGEFYGFGVDSGMGCFVDYAALPALKEVTGPAELYEKFEEVDHRAVTVRVTDPESGACVVAFGAGWGDGSYPTWIGRTAQGDVACFVVDTLVLHEGTEISD